MMPLAAPPNVEKNWHQSLLYPFKRLKKEKVPNSLYEASITMTPKPGKDIIREKQTNILCEYWGENPQQNTGKPNSTAVKGNVHHDHMRFIPGVQGWFTTYED